jgi:hypothetical protein
MKMTTDIDTHPMKTEEIFVYYLRVTAPAILVNYGSYSHYSKSQGRMNKPRIVCELNKQRFIDIALWCVAIARTCPGM